MRPWTRCERGFPAVLRQQKASAPTQDGKSRTAWPGAGSLGLEQALLHLRTPSAPGSQPGDSELGPCFQKRCFKGDQSHNPMAGGHIPASALADREGEPTPCQHQQELWVETPAVYLTDESLGQCSLPCPLQGTPQAHGVLLSRGLQREPWGWEHPPATQSHTHLLTRASS